MVILLTILSLYLQENYPCSRIGAEIATIYSATENELARQACGGLSCWIGLEEVGGDASTPKESQTWRWMDGSDAAYTNWVGWEPNNYDGRFTPAFILLLTDVIPRHKPHQTWGKLFR